jgi:hypothetical protein
MDGEGALIFDGPDLTGYASRTWIERQVRDPEKHYGELNEMPAFEGELDDNDLRTVTAFLRLQRFEEPAHPLGELPKPDADKPDADKPESQE